MIPSSMTETLAPLLLGISWMDPAWLLDRFGNEMFWIAVVIVFVECGLLFPLLPGDTLLFATGLFVATGQIDVFGGPVWTELALALTTLVLAAFAGNVTGYEIGRVIGRTLHERDGRFLKRSHLDRTHEFFDHHGVYALILGRFVPFVRTFITLVAGAAAMPRRHFWLWSFVGALLWIVSMTLLGYFLGAAFPGIADHLEVAMLLIVAVFLIPLWWEWRSSRDATRSR